MEDIKVASYVSIIGKKIMELNDRHSKYYKSELLVAFRGEPRDYEKSKLMPSLFRNDEYIAKELHLFELFCDYNIVESAASNIEKAIEAQHYASISRMLDITFDALIALYFACNHEDEHGYLFVFAFPEHYSPHSKYIELFYTDILEGNYLPYSRNFKVFSHSYSNDRIKAQKGGFVFFPGREYLPINECYYEKILVKKEDKKVLKEELNILFQINDFTIFPEKEKLAMQARNKFCNTEYHNQKVSIADELETFFSRIDYELKMNSDKTNKGKKYTLRMLRKEKKDILSYLKTVKSEETIDFESLVDRNFNILKMGLGKGKI